MTEQVALEQALAALGRARAPDGFAGRVLDRAGLPDRYARVDTSIGPLFVAYGAAGLRAVVRAADGAAAFEDWYRARFGRPLRAAPRAPDDLAARIERELSSGRRSLRLDLSPLRPFERAVLETTRRIPRGEVRTYAWVAREIGRPGAVRAVGTALAHNPLVYVVPCHRVVRTDGHIGNYSGGGPAAKRALLRLEGADPDRLEALAEAGVRYFGSDTTRIFCLPSCRDARRVTDRHRVTFHSEREAQAAGYRACRHCRPAA